jgi:hypothetical protein
MLHKKPFAVLSAVLALSIAAPAGAVQIEPPASSPLILRVRDAVGSDVNAAAEKLAAQFDLLEMREDDDLFVLGNVHTIERMRANGYSVEVQQVLPEPPRFGTQTFYGGYRTVAEHEARLVQVAADHPDLVQLIDYGDSWRKTNGRANGHDLLALCITKFRDGDCALTPETDKPRLLIIAAIHARELTVAELAQRWIDYLVAGYGVDADVTTLLDSSEMWVVPLANPDGRSIVEQNSADPYYHRKNANIVDAPCSTPIYSYYYDGSHPGVDLNRNGSWKWDLKVTASDVKCSAVYRGPAAASEPENVHIETLIRQLFRDQRGQSLNDAAPITTTGVFLTLHSFADQVILPWNFTTAFHAPNDLGLRALAFRMSRHNGYLTGQSGEVLYSTSGSTDDFTYGELGVPSYTFEVGPGYGGCAGFMPPFSCMDGFWKENLGAFLFAAKAAREPYALSHGPVPTAISSTPTADGAHIVAAFDDDAFGTNGYGRPSAQVVVSAELFLDAPPWAGGVPVAMTPVNGAGDETLEAFEASLRFYACESMPTQAWVRAFDEYGATGVFAATWISPSLNGAAPTICDVQIDRPFVVTNSTAAVQIIVSTTLPISITAAEMQIGASDFVSDVIAMTPVDGAADSATEAFTATIDGALLAVGIHTATLRALTASAAYTPTRELTFAVLPPWFKSVYVPSVLKQTIRTAVRFPAR